MPIIKTKKTQEEITKDVVSEVIRYSNNLESNLLQDHAHIYNLVWNNEQATPQEIFDGLGADVKQIFEASIAIQTLLKTLDSSYEVLTAPYEYEITAQGVVVGDKIVVEVEELPAEEGVTESVE